MKILINDCYGGYNLSTEAYQWLIKDGVDWEIKEYRGAEHIAERHRTWS